MNLAPLLERADRYLRSAKLLLDDGDTSSCASRAYYAMFFAAEAMLLSRSIEIQSHRGLISRFGDEFVKDGTFPARMGRDLSRAFKARQQAEYEVGTPLTADAARELLIAAEQFVEGVRGRLPGEDAT